MGKSKSKIKKKKRRLDLKAAENGTLNKSKGHKKIAKLFEQSAEEYN